MKQKTDKKMKYKDFEDYLKTKHSEENPEVLDDMLPDDFERWLADLDIDSWIIMGNNYGKIKEEEGKV